MKRVTWLLPVLLSCAGHGPLHRHGHGPGLRFDRSAETVAAGLPFSDAVGAGGLLFLSGQVGVRPGTNGLVPGGSRPRPGSVSRASAPSWSATDRASIAS